MLETGPDTARAAGRTMLGIYLTMENYRANWLRMGLAEAGMADGGSDRLINAMFAWGGETALRTRIQQHWHAGADHVCIQPVDPSGAHALDDRAL